ncbi:MAG: efflux RND transporter periplasmic adaptor subunit [Hyphomonadaceae bacterium]
MPRWISITLGAIAVFAVLFGIRTLMGGRDGIPTVEADAVPTLEKTVGETRATRDGMPVIVRRSVAEMRPLFVSLSGRTEAMRTTTLKSETSGTVTSAPAQEGSLVKAGDMLCELGDEGRAARVREAEADVRARELEFKAASELVKKGWAVAAREQAARAALDSAKASLTVARSELSKSRIRAPFDGVFEARMADVGDFLAPGSACGTVIQLDPILVVADASEQIAPQIKPDARARLALSDGAETSGRVRYVAKTADPTTRNFRVEIELANPGGVVTVGRAAEVRIQIGEGYAHRITHNLLTLDDQGRIGLRYLDVGGVVSFIRADVVDETADGMWIAGLPREALIVEEGQDAVKPGVRARPVFKDNPPANTPPT